MTSYKLAIDFGTDFTLATIRAESAALERVRFEGDDRMPSAVVLDENGTLHAGPHVLDEAELSPAAVEWTAKRLLGEGPVVLARRVVEEVSLVSAVFGHVADEVKGMFNGREPEAVILTHPAVWTMARVARLEEAARRAELQRVQSVPEPVAAACALGACQAR